MTPKEKAIDLFRDMEFEIPYIHDPTEPQGDDIAKKCALIAVNIIIFELKIRNCSVKYFEEVKQELELL